MTENLRLDISELEKMQPDELVSLVHKTWDAIRNGGQVTIERRDTDAPPEQLHSIVSIKEHDNFTRLLAHGRFRSIYSVINPKLQRPSS
jgi:hypothetical protein